MNITKENKDELNAVLKVEVNEEDYKEKVDKVIKDYKKKAKMDGFRPGKVPEGLIRKMYGRAIKIDEINKMVSQKISEYIKSEDVNILGEPLPSKDEQKEINWDYDKEFEFAFDVGLSPEFEVKMSGHDKIPYYTIKVDDELIDNQIESYQKRMGEFKEVDEVNEKTEMLTAALTELDEDGNPKKDGVNKPDATLSLEMLKDDEIKSKFENAKPGDEIDLDLKKAYPNDAELSSMLNVNKEDLENINNQFRLKIDTIKKFEKAEVNQEFYDKIYGEGEVTSDEEFRQKIADELQEQLKPESDRKFAIDAKNHFVRKTNPQIPADFLKRWLKESQSQKDENQLTEEQIEEEFPRFIEDVKWDLIKNKIIKDHEIKVEEEEVLELAKKLTMQQFQQYGMMNLPDEQLEQYAKQVLQQEEQKRKMYEQKYEDKVIELIKEKVKLEEKEVTMDEFKKLVEEDQNKQSK
jgi:trigger factor